MDWFENPGYFRLYRRQVAQAWIFLGIKAEEEMDVKLYIS